MPYPTLTTLCLFVFSVLASSACSLSALQSVTLNFGDFVETGRTNSFGNLSSSFIYTENDRNISIDDGVLAKSNGLSVSASRSYHDTTLCKSWTEHIVTDPAHPYVIQSQISLSDDGVFTKLDVLVADEGDFAFDAAMYQKNAYSQASNWTLIPEAQRDSRKVIQAAADAYFDHLHGRTPFPAATPCWIIGGGAFFGEEDPGKDHCTHEPIKEGHVTQTMTDRRYVINEAYGVVNIFTKFQGLDKALPKFTPLDSHLFRIENGMVSVIHVTGTCSTHNCGWDLESE